MSEVNTSHKTNAQVKGGDTDRHSPGYSLKNEKQRVDIVNSEIGYFAVSDCL